MLSRAAVCLRSSRLCSAVSFVQTNSFYKNAYVMGKGKPTEDPMVTEPTQTNLGEDSYFMVQDPAHLTFGVADGVGGWTLEENGRPDLVAQNFMKLCEEVTKEYYGMALTPGIASQIIFAQAYERLQAAPPGLGSTTGLVVVCFGFTACGLVVGLMSVFRTLSHTKSSS